MDSKTIIKLGAALAFLAVAIGAFGAHGLAKTLEANGRVDTFETAVRYHMYHALAIVLVGLVGSRLAEGTTTWVALLFLAGILIFSGSLYVLSITNVRWLGAITPIGGVCFLAAWAILVLKVS